MQQKEHSFVQKVWIAAAVVALTVVVLWLAKATFNVWLLVLAGVLIAVYFRGLSDLIQRKTKWNGALCLALSILGSLLLLALLFWLMGAKIQAQVTELSNQFPTTIDNAKVQLNKSPLGQKILEGLSSPAAQKRARSLAQSFFKSSFGVFGDLYVVLFLGIFFTVSPKLYRDGIVQLVPPAGKQTAAGVLKKLGENLKKWLKGKLFAMLVVFVLTAIGLSIIGVPLWLVLAISAGILNFIPNFGPLIALVPAALVGLLQGPATAFWVIGLYLFVQVAESNFITPMVQRKLVNIPPALIIIAQLLIAPLTSYWGLILATPLMLIVIVLVQELYIKRQKER